MLKRIQCDKFKENNKVRSSFEFNNGLNTILGDDVGSNSIGKSTLLLIIDFVFGGNDYIKKSTDVINNIGPHTIKFVFEFQGFLYYFSRATHDFENVNICDEQFNVIKVIENKNFCNLLREKYSLDIPDLSFRDGVGRFARIHGRETLEPKKPFHSAVNQPYKSAIESVLKLFDYFKFIKSQQNATEESLKIEKIFKEAQKYNFLPLIKSKEQLKLNHQKIALLQEEMTALENSNNIGFLDKDLLFKEQIIDINQELRLEKTKLLFLIQDLESIEENIKNEDGVNPTDYENLKEFFPEINLRKIEEVENFRFKLGVVLNSDLNEKRSSLRLLVKLSQTKIDELENRRLHFTEIPTVESALLTRYSDKQREIFNLQNINKIYSERENLVKNSKEQKALLESLTKKYLYDITSKVNNTMNELYNEISFNKNPPRLNIKSIEQYSFKNENDSGTGTGNKALITFDLSILKLTKLPFVIHDSVLLKQIEDESIEKILKGTSINYF